MSENSKRAEKIFEDLATGFACLQVQYGINMRKAVLLLNDLALLYGAMETRTEVLPEVKGPIGYTLSPIAAEGMKLVDNLEHDAGYSGVLDGSGQRLREIIEVMDVEISSRGIALSNVKSNELTGPSAENPAKESQELPPAPADGKADPAEGAEK